MILTLTPNPSLDRTIELAAALERGEVQRATAASQHPGGKGVNIVRALSASGIHSSHCCPATRMTPSSGPCPRSRSRT